MGINLLMGLVLVFGFPAAVEVRMGIPKVALEPPEGSGTAGVPWEPLRG